MRRERQRTTREPQGAARRARRAAAVLAAAGLAAAGLAPAASAGGRGSRHGSLPATVEQSADHVVLSNGFVRAAFDLRHPGIDLLSGDFEGRGQYGGDLTASGPDPLNRSGIVLERDDALPARVVDTIGITDTAHGNSGQLPGPVPYSLAAELLPGGGREVVPPADTHEDAPLRLLDTSGAKPNVAVARGQAFGLAAADRSPMRAVHVFALSTDGDSTGTFTLRFADGSTETHQVTIPDWGAGPVDQDALHPAFDMPYRRSGSGNQQHRFIVYDAVLPVSSTQPLASVTLPDGVPNASTSIYPTQLNVLGLTFERAAGGYFAPPLDANDPAPGAGRHSSSAGAAPGLRVTVLERGARRAAVRIDGVADDPGDPLVTSSWTLKLDRGSRALDVRVNARALRDADVAGLRLVHALKPIGAYGFFDRGVTQRLESPAPWFASRSRLERFYALGGGGAVDVRASGQRETVLRNAPAAGATPALPASGIEQVLAGEYPHPDEWDGAGWSKAAATKVASGQQWSLRARIAPNNRDFPSGGVPAQPSLPTDDLAAVLTAVYGSAAGVLDTYALPGLVAPTVPHPGWPYGNGRNFYDPDTFFTDSALLWSGDRYLARQARETIERSESEMADSGQLPHHFEGPNPTFVAISGATQTGPNIFWIQAALRYVEATGDERWLRAHMPSIERALGFLTNRFDPAVGMIDAPGPLWIDVFIRNGFTADTNAYMVGLLRDVAEAEERVGRMADATGHRDLAGTIAAAMNDRLWAGDHYVTQLNRDGTTRDLVDYDANLLAVANGVATGERAAAVLARVDGGACTHGRATWVSERYYGPADTYNGNTGDSAVSMARIGWADAHARAAARDAGTFQNVLLAPLQRDLLERTWLTERYDCAGNATRAGYYHEYPELVAMLLGEVAYGIRVGLAEVTIDPLSRSDFHWALGRLDVRHSAREVHVRVPGSGSRRFTITGLTPGAPYRVAHGGRTVADASGTVRFEARLDRRGVDVKRLGRERSTEK